MIYREEEEEEERPTFLPEFFSLQNARHGQTTKSEEAERALYGNFKEQNEEEEEEEEEKGEYEEETWMAINNKREEECERGKTGESSVRPKCKEEKEEVLWKLW